MRGPPSRPSALGLAVLITVTCAFTQPARAQDGKEALGATVGGLLAASRQLSPTLRAAALDTAAAAAKAEGADALDDPILSDSYQYYEIPTPSAAMRSW
jgi:hypothetical protein